MMNELNAAASEPDQETKEINGMLEKLLDVQHPERVTERLKEQSFKNKAQVFPVSASGNELAVSVLDNTISSGPVTDSSRAVATATNGFYSLDDNISNTDMGGSTITAVIHENQTLVAGATVKLRLTSDIYIQGVLIPKDQLVFGTAMLNGERLMIAINSIRYRNGLYPVALSVYDLDGMDGISIPGAITRDVAKQSADQSLQGLGLTSLDPTIGMQAASAGIEVTKNLLSKRVKLVKVMLKAGYQVLLKDNNNK
jgi:conjugative transposon TraM protein